MKLIGKLLAVDIFAPNIVFQLFFCVRRYRGIYKRERERERGGGVGTYKSVRERERDLAHD